MSLCQGDDGCDVELCFWVHCFGRNIPSDWEFLAQFRSAFCKLMWAMVSLTSGYHPETNGHSERLNQDLKTGLYFLSSGDPLSWLNILLWSEYALNNTITFDSLLVRHGPIV